MNAEVPAATPQEAARLLEQGALLVDVRERLEWNQARIPGAELRPLSGVNGWWESLPRDRTVILYCRSGSRSAQLTQALVSQAGFDNVLNLTGGIIAWAEAGLEVEEE